MMKRMLTLLIAAVCFVASAQTESSYPFNPDYDGDGFISVADVLGFLTFFDQSATLQTCFKGELCLFMQGQGINTSESNCGTIAAHTSSAIQNKYIHVTGDDYVEGDVIHLIHICQTQSAGNRARFYTHVEGEWLEFVVLGDPVSGGMTARAIFNGDWWELLDQE